MKKFVFARHAALAGVAVAMAFPAAAADIQEPMVVEAPEPAPIYTQAPAEVGGWYIRGDVGYHQSKVRDIDYLIAVPGPPVGIVSGTLRGKLDGGFGVGGGVGYQVNQNFRVDLTADHWFKTDFKGSSAGFYDADGPGGPILPVGYTTSDRTSVSTWLLLANAYVDLGTWHGITPYVGAGIGGAYIKWDKLRNTPSITPPPEVVHEGAGSWRFAAAVMAGASYCLTKNVKLDAGYRFSHIKGGKMFQYAAGGNNGPGFDGGFNTHEVRAGLRYQFGGGSSDCGPEEVAYEPTPEPIYK